MVEECNLYLEADNWHKGAFHPHEWVLVVADTLLLAIGILLLSSHVLKVYGLFVMSHDEKLLVVNIL